LKSIGLKKLAGVISPRWREPAKCASCGGDFTCGATLSGCWCAEIKLTDIARKKLKTSYTGCLCRTCLETAASCAPKSEDE